MKKNIFTILKENITNLFAVGIEEKEFYKPTKDEINMLKNGKWRDNKDLLDKMKKYKLDLSFTNLQGFDVERIMNLSLLINFFRINDLPKSHYIANGEYATFLNAKRSVGGWSGGLLTTTITQTKQEYTDNSAKKSGFNLFSFKKKEV